MNQRVGGLTVWDWALPPDAPSRGTVLVVHGLGEHAGRYQHLAHELNRWGFAVRSYDQYGHGLSDGPRGGLPSDTRLLDDLATIVDDTRHRIGDAGRLILLGHSMGGLIASQFVAQSIRPVTALVLSSPALNAGLNPVQKMLVAVLPRLLPNLRVGNGLDATWISHDPQQVAAYLSDPLVHDRIAARLARYIADGGPQVIAQANHWSVPTLLMFAGTDRLVQPQGSRTFAARAPAHVVTSHEFPALYHELFNETEPERSAVLDTLKLWLDLHCG